MEIQRTKDGKNGSIRVSGHVRPGDKAVEVILDLSQFATPSQGWKGIRIDSALWLLQEKLGIKLWWGDPTLKSNLELDKLLIFPMESRNFIKLEDGISSPRVPVWDGKIYMTAVGADTPKSFMFILDFDKQ